MSSVAPPTATPIPQATEFPVPPGIDEGALLSRIAQAALAGGCPFPWTWAAFYRGSYVSEHGPDGVTRAFGAVDLARVVSFMLVPLHAGLPFHTQHIEPRDGVRPIFFRRLGRVGTAGDDGVFVDAGEAGSIHVLGWQQTLYDADGREKSVTHYTFYFADGTSLATSDYQAV